MQFMCCQVEQVSQQIQGEPLSREEAQTQRMCSGGSLVGLGRVVVLRRLEGWEVVEGTGEGEVVWYLRGFSKGCEGNGTIFW